MVAHSNHGAPSNAAIARAAPMNGSVITTAAGSPRRSKVMPSCTLHELQEPQSPIAVSTTCARSANIDTTRSEAGKLGCGFWARTTPAMR